MKTADELRNAATSYCIVTASTSSDLLFGEKSRQVEFLAKSNWILIRGNRHQALEREFFTFVLETHNEAFLRIYGVSAIEIASGIQDITDSMRIGHQRSKNHLDEQLSAIKLLSKERRLPFNQSVEIWKKENPNKEKLLGDAHEDLFSGGICNLTKHTSLPTTLLDDLSFERGENTDFFAPGTLTGTPLRTLPARTKPLIKLDGQHFAIDPCFVRDTMYRALLHNIAEKDPSYGKEFRIRQQKMSESAFIEILSDHLQGANIYREVFYKDVGTNQWVENDVLICLDDILILLEAKSGATATIASPATDFNRHIRAIQELITRAYTQCRRFLEYLASNREVVIFKRELGKYRETGRIRLY